MLELEPVKGTKEVTDSDSGATFTIKPMSAEKHSALRGSCLSKKTGEVDPIEFGAKAAVAIIVSWTGVGKNKDDGECQAHDVAKKQFGKRFAYTLMPWLIEEAMELDQALAAEMEDAKNG